MNEFDPDMIIRYLDGEMNAEEFEAFEKQLKLDAELQKKVELYKDINDTLKMKMHPDDNERALRNTLKGMVDEYFHSKAKVVPLMRARWLAAAAAVLIVAVTLTIWSRERKDLYRQYADIQMPAVAERGIPVDSLLKRSTEYFNNKSYSESLPLFEAILKDDPQNSFVHYYYAIALLENGKIEKSRAELVHLYNGNSLFRYDAAFYMALSYLKEKNKTTCKEWLNKIPPDADVYIKALQLVKKL